MTSKSRRLLRAMALGVALLCAPSLTRAQDALPTIQTVVGGGPVSAPALQVTLAQITAIARGPDGALYLALRDHAAVYRMSASGQVTVIAGNGSPGFTGDGGPASRAKLNAPSGVAVDAVGNVYIADRLAQRVRRVSVDGMISTFAGGGASQADGVPATQAALGDPRGLALTSTGDLLVADSSFVKVRRVSTAGVISTVAGNGSTSSTGEGVPATSTGLNVPIAVAVDPSGNILIAEYNGHRVRRVSGAGLISTFAGTGTAGGGGDGGAATGAQLNGPQGLAVDASGDVYIAEELGHRVRRVDALGSISRVAGTGVGGFGGDGGPATAALLLKPQAVGVDANDRLIIGDSDNQRLRRVEADGTITTIAGDGRIDGAWTCCLAGFSGDGGTATAAQLWSPGGIALDSAGNLFIADERNHRVRRVTPAGVITTVAGTGLPGYSGDGGLATAAQLNHPSGVSVDAAGNVFVADDLNARIRRVATNGTITTFAGTGQQGLGGDGGPANAAQLFRPRSVAVNSAGDVFIAEAGNQRVRKVTAGVITTIFIGSVTSVGLGSNGNVLVLEGNTQHRVLEVSPAGAVTPLVGTGIAGYSGDGGPATAARIYAPTGAALDSSGNLYLSDSGNNRIRVVSTSGQISTYAGLGGLGFEGDNGPAVLARFANPWGIAVDPLGRVFVADLSNNRIRAIIPPSPPVSTDDAYVTTAGTVLSVSAPGVLANDTSDGGTMTASLVGNVSHGTLTLAPTGGFSYQPVTGYFGIDAFTYRAINAVGSGNLVTVTLEVQPVVPLSAGDSYAVVSGSDLAIADPGVLGNDVSNGGAMVASLVSGVTHGVLTLTASGGFTYRSAAGFIGVDIFTYRATNTAGAGNVVSVTIQVNGRGLEAPQGLRVASVVGNVVTLRWTAPPGSATPENHVLEGGVTAGQVLASIPTGLAEPVFTFIAPTGSFFVRVHALGGGVRTAASNEVRLHVGTSVAPSAPTHLLGLVVGSRISLSWRNSFLGGEPQESLLDVTGSLTATLPLTATQTFDFPFVPGGTYTFSVRSRNGGGVSGPSNAVTLAFPEPCSGAPNTPTNFIAYLSQGLLHLLWEPPPAGAAPTDYVLGVTGSYVGSLPVGTSRQFQVVPPPGIFGLSVVARNACGSSSPTITTTVSVP